MPSLIFNYGDWDFWAPYNPATGVYGNQAVTFDGNNKLILVNEGVTEINFREDVYSNWKEWVKTRDNAKYPDAVSAAGGDPLPGQRVLGTTFFLENGWRMRTWEGNHDLTVTGNVFTRTGEALFVPTLQPWTITINLNTSTLVEALIPESSLSSADIESIVNSVWNSTLDDSTTPITILNSLVADIQQIPTEVWNEIIDDVRNESAASRLKRIATITQDIALR